MSEFSIQALFKNALHIPEKRYANEMPSKSKVEYLPAKAMK